jgi:putative GTP pyrophosphokinase
MPSIQPLDQLADSLKGRTLNDFVSEKKNDVKQRVVSRLVNDDNFSAMVSRNVNEYRRLMTYYECAIMEIETKFRVLSAEYNLQHDRNPIESIKTRLKSTDSLAKKLARKEFPVSVESIEQNIFDVAGVRVVCTFLEDLYSLADAFLAQDDVLLIERRDYISEPKPSGYRSLHLIVETPIYLEREKRMVKVEVQLRTISMNFWASLEHQLRYKKELDEEASEAVASELAHLAEDAADLDARMQALRTYLNAKGVSENAGASRNEWI